MSIRVMSQVWDLQLSSTEKLVLLALADCANDEGECWPSIATIGRKACIGERSVQRSIQSLKEAGHLSRKEVVGKGCRYHIHPRHNVTPATVSRVTNETVPPPQCRPTPATVAPKPSLNHQEPSNNKDTRARALPADWFPVLTPASQRIVDSWPPGMLEAELEKFRDHASDKGRTSKDWQAAFRTWIKNANSWKPANGNASRNDRRDEQPANPYVRAELARQAAQSGDGIGQPDCWP